MSFHGNETYSYGVHCGFKSPLKRMGHQKVTKTKTTPIAKGKNARGFICNCVKLNAKPYV